MWLLRRPAEKPAFQCGLEIRVQLRDSNLQKMADFRHLDAMNKSRNLDVSRTERPTKTHSRKVPTCLAKSCKMLISARFMPSADVIAGLHDTVRFSNLRRELTCRRPKAFARALGALMPTDVERPVGRKERQRRTRHSCEPNAPGSAITCLLMLRSETGNDKTGHRHHAAFGAKAVLNVPGVVALVGSSGEIRHRFDRK